MNTKIALARCLNYSTEQVSLAVNKVLDLLGGIEAFIGPKSKVLIKPNLLTDNRPQDCITTHPKVLESIIISVKKTGADIFVGDSPSVFGEIRKIDRVYEITGIKEVCQRQKVNLVYFNKAVLKDGLPLADWAFKCDHIINVPKFKTHGLTILTAGIKNLFGLILGMHKLKIHRDYFEIDKFSQRIVDILELRPPTLTIVDGVVSLEGDGPGSSGIRTDTQFILGGSDVVAIDSILAVIMGIFPEDVPTTKEAVRRNLGISDLSKINVLGDNLGEFIYSSFKLPKGSLIYNLPKPLLDIAKLFIWHNMKVISSHCKSCKKCLEVCPTKAVYLKDTKAFIDVRKCILCCCCQEICPHQAITLNKSLLLKLMGV